MMSCNTHRLSMLTVEVKKEMIHDTETTSTWTDHTIYTTYILGKSNTRLGAFHGYFGGVI